MLKIVPKSRELPDFGTNFNIFAKLIFALKFVIWVLTYPNNMHKISMKLLLQVKNDSDGKIAILCKFLSRLGKSTHMDIDPWSQRWHQKPPSPWYEIA